jgi:hypothetical protein
MKFFPTTALTKLKTCHFALLFILCSFSVPTMAQEFANWVAGAMDDNEGYFAATVNDSTSIFGQYC